VYGGGEHNRAAFKLLPRGSRDSEMELDDTLDPTT
jgi:hypothetical protein